MSERLMIHVTMQVTMSMSVRKVNISQDCCREEGGGAFQLTLRF